MTSAATALEVAPEPTIELVGIHRHYGHGEAQVRALDGVDMSIHAGQFVAVMGSSGSGKSTCMNIVGGLDRPTAGRYLFQGVDVGALDNDQLALLRRHYIGFVFQSFNLLARTSALDNVMLPLVYRRVPRRERRERAMAKLELVGLADRAGHTPQQLSGGQQQRVAIARALVSEPALVLADEPTGNLDSKRSAEIMALLARLNADEGITIMLVTHEPDMAAWVQRVLWFTDGRLERDGPPEEVFGVRRAHLESLTEAVST